MKDDQFIKRPLPIINQLVIRLFVRKKEGKVTSLFGGSYWWDQYGNFIFLSGSVYQQH